MNGMKEERVPRQALKGYIEMRRSLGRPRGRWSDALDRAAKRILKCRNWRMAEDVYAWRQRTVEAKAQVGL